MIKLEEISRHSFDYNMAVFRQLFDYNTPSLKDDYESIFNFLTTTYEESELQFDYKVNNLKTIDELIFYIVDNSNEVIGYCCIFPNRWTIDPKEYELGIFIKKEDRGKGIGSLAINLLEDFVKTNLSPRKIVLSPRIENEKAMKLYQKLNYDYEPNSYALSYGFICMSKSFE